MLYKGLTFKIRVKLMVHTCNPSNSGGRGRRILSSRQARAKLVRPYLKNKIKRGWRGVSSGRAPAQHVLGPGFCPQ
jgi:hypothetical protein